MEYFKGDKIEYTGKTDDNLYGKFAYEFIYTEGHKKGQTGWTYNTPAVA